MVTVTQTDAPGWSRWVTDFDGTARLFSDQFATLKALGPYVQARHPELQAQYNKLLVDGAKHQVTLATLTKTRNQVVGWLTNIGAAIESAESATLDWLRSRLGLGGLGAVPLLVVAISLGAAAAALIVIANWIKASAEMTQRLNAFHTLEAQGQKPKDAAAIVSQIFGTPSSIPWRLLAIAAVAVFLGPPLLRQLRGSP